MSTLTKILIVLLTFSSIFLCGIVVTYVGSAQNFKEKSEDQSSQISSARSRNTTLEAELETVKANSERIQANLNQEKNALEIEIQGLTTQLRTAEAARDDASQRLGNLADVTDSFRQTNESQRQLLENTMAENKELLALKSENETELNELTASNIENMAIINQLREEIRRLTEEKTELLSRANQQLQTIGREATAPVPVTPQVSQAQAAATTAPIRLNGLVKAVDMEQNMVEIDLGTADGVTRNMNFHVIRGDRFICDIIIFEVDADRAIGIPELIQETPIAGDFAKTNL
ncbi:hypothetical protein ACFLZ8_05005 [Planctomycetota bacterium]